MKPFRLDENENVHTAWHPLFRHWTVDHCIRLYPPGMIDKKRTWKYVEVWYISCENKKKIGNKTITAAIVVGLNRDAEIFKTKVIICNFTLQDNRSTLQFNQSISGSIFKLLANNKLHGGFIFGECDGDRFVKSCVSSKAIITCIIRHEINRGLFQIALT